MRRVLARATTVTVALALAWPAAAAAQAPPGARVSNDVVYGTGRVAQPRPRAFPLLLDLYQPARTTKRRRPVVILIHGGGFSGGTRKQPELARIAEALVRRGFVVANVDYRLSGQAPVASRRVRPLAAAVPQVPVFAGMVAAVDDTLTAADWLARRARRLHLDLGRLGVVGSSAGAITAAHVAYVLDDLGVRGPRVRFVGDLWGGILIPPSERSADQLEAREAALFAVHGDADPTVPVALDDRLVARARRVGVRVEYLRIAGGGHGFGRTGFFTRRAAHGQTPFRRLLAFASRAVR